MAEVKKLIKTNNDNFKEHQVAEREFISIIAKKDAEISDLKTIIEDCNCHNYSKSIDDIYRAGIKHRDKLVSLKDIADAQKRKISNLEEEKTLLINQVELLELESETDKGIVFKLKDKIEYRG